VPGVEYAIGHRDNFLPINKRGRLLFPPLAAGLHASSEALGRFLQHLTYADLYISSQNSYYFSHFDYIAQVNFTFLGVFLFILFYSFYYYYLFSF
jgi:hypothetical protein